MTKKEMLDFVTAQPDDEEYAIVIWSEKDVKAQSEGAIDRHATYPLTVDECKEIINNVHEEHDCNNGITWDTLDYWIEQAIRDRGFQR